MATAAPKKTATQKPAAKKPAAKKAGAKKSAAAGATKKTVKATTATAKTEKSAATSSARKANPEAADRVLEQLQTGGQNAIGAVRRFIDSTDESLRGGAKEPTFIHDIVDSALEMSDRMVEHGGDALRGIVRSASNR